MLLNIEAEAAVDRPSSAFAFKGCTPPRSLCYLYLLCTASWPSKAKTRLARAKLSKLATYIPTTISRKIFCEMAKIKFISAVAVEILNLSYDSKLI